MHEVMSRFHEESKHLGAQISARSKRSAGRSLHSARSKKTTSLPPKIRHRNIDRRSNVMATQGSVEDADPASDDGGN